MEEKLLLLLLENLILAGFGRPNSSLKWPREKLNDSNRSSECVCKSLEFAPIDFAAQVSNLIFSSQWLLRLLRPLLCAKKFASMDELPVAQTLMRVKWLTKTSRQSARKCHRVTCCSYDGRWVWKKSTEKQKETGGDLCSFVWSIYEHLQMETQQEETQSGSI